jgi:hypothetical protein
MDSLRTVINDIKVFFYGGLTTLPLSIAGTMLIIGMFTANYAMIFFLCGYLIFVPGIVLIVNMIMKAFDYSSTRSSNCGIVIPFTTLRGTASSSYNDGISYWLPMITFFIGYMLHNSISLYLMNFSNDSANPESVKNRKMLACISFATIIVFAVIILYFRLVTECDSPLEMIPVTLLFTALGAGYYYLINIHGELRLTDLFGIANRVLKPSELNNGPIACAPVPVG